MEEEGVEHRYQQQHCYQVVHHHDPTTYKFDTAGRLNFRHTGPSRLKWRCREIRVRFPSGVMLCIFAMSRKLNSISLQHNFIPATCCCGDASRGEGTHYPGLRTEIQSCKVSAPLSRPPLQARAIATGLHQPSYLLCTFFA